MGYGGSETYSLEVFPRWAKSPHDFTLLLNSNSGDALRKIPGISVHEAPKWARNQFARHLYQKYCLPQILVRDNYDVLFIPGGQSGTPNLLKKHVKRVSMLRNMLPFDRRERRRFSFIEYPWIRCRLEILASSLLKSFRASDRFIFISKYSSEIVGPLLKGIDSRIIPHGVSLLESDSINREKLADYNLPSRYLLYVSVVDPYKHQNILLEAMQRMPKDTPPLVLAGPVMGKYGEKVRSLVASMPGRALILGAVPRSRLSALMAHAELLLFGSTCETCPNILLEYMQAGRPIICSNSKPMPEFGGDAVRYVDAENAAQWAAAISEILSSESKRVELMVAAQSRVIQFSWDRTAAETLRAITEWKTLGT